jgi:hypothetical protein
MPLTQTQGYRAALYQAQVVLTPQVFREWLVQRYYQTVGTGGDGDVCPLACYFRAMTGVAFEVGRFDCHVLGTDLSFPLPLWAKVFVEVADRDYADAAVTGGQALVLLDVAERYNSPFKR